LARKAVKSRSRVKAALDLCTGCLSLVSNEDHSFTSDSQDSVTHIVCAGCSCVAQCPENQSPLSTPTSEALNSPLLSTITDIPTFRPDKMTITGVLLQDANTPRPVAGAILYLANLLPDSSGKLTLASFDKVSSPHTQTDAVGRFVFADVPASPYSLVLFRIADSYLLKDPTSGGDLLFDSKAGQVLDVGRLVYSSLPSDSSAP
jgi:hypothetical protein